MKTINKASTRSMSQRRLMVTLGLIGCLALSTTAFAQAVLNPNQITGTVEFTNKNPVILNVLESSGLGEGINHLYIRADSIDVTPALNNYAYLTATGDTSTEYQLTVESSPSGIPYRMSGELRLDSHGDRYVLEPSESAAVFPEPNPDVNATIQQCAGMLDINFVNTEGDPVALQGGNILAHKETAYTYGTYYRVQAQDFHIKSGSSREFLAVNGDGSKYRVDITMEGGSDPHSDLIRDLCRKEVTASCDEVVPITCVLGGSMELGAISGTVDMLGETELDILYFTRMRAFDGPLNNYRYGHVAGSGDYLLPNLVPSDVETPSRNYKLYGEMAFRTGYRTQYFRTPWLDGYNNPSVKVEAGKTTDLGNTFVMEPGSINGLILLAGPPVTEGQSFLEDIHRDADNDYNQDGIPNNVHIISSRVGARGINIVPEGATMSSNGGLARAGFEGSYDKDISSFVGDYQLVLGGLNSEASIWNPGKLVLRFLDYTTPDVPESYQSSYLTVTDKTVSNHVVTPGSTARLDHTYCMNQVLLSYKTLSGTFFNPRAWAIGTFEGTDFLDKTANYQVNLNYAYGTPRSQSTAANRGLVSMALPQGSYTVTPTVTAVNPNGTTSNTELPPVSFDVACRQDVQLTTDLQLSTDELPVSTDQQTVSVSGVVNSLGNVVVIKYSHNQRPEVVLCNNCGKNPTYNFEVSLDDGANEIVVTAEDEYGDISKSTSFVNFEPAVEPEPTTPFSFVGCSNKAVTVGAYDAGTRVDFNIGTEGGCSNPTVTCNATSGDYFMVGSHNVSCSAVDSCGTQLQCQFSISVTAEEPEEEETPECNTDKELTVTHELAKTMLWPPNHRLRDVGLSVAIDDPCADESNTSGASVTTEVWSNEPEAPMRNLLRGRFAPDAKDMDSQLKLRAERRGKGGGRVYLIITRATASDGQSSFSCSTVKVPKNRSRRWMAGVNQLAGAAKTYCEANNGAAPDTFFQHGIGSGQEQACKIKGGEASISQSVQRTMLWPPNHNLVNIGLQTAIEDPCGSLGENAESSMVTEVWSDEPELPRKGDGSGRFAPDAKGMDGNVLRLRAERKGKGNGRVYLLITKSASSSDEAVFSCSTATVPHSNSREAKNLVKRQADRAKSYCEANSGTAPSNFFQHGLSEEVGPKQ